MKKAFAFISISILLSAAVFVALLFLPKNNPQTYRIKIENGQGIAAVGNRLAKDDIIYSRHVLVGAAYMLGVHNHLQSGSYKLPQKVSAWQILQKLKKAESDTVTVQIIEGMRFAQMRRIINQTADLKHDTAGWSDEKLLKEIDPEAGYTRAEGLFAPDSYELDAGSSDLQLYKLAYRTMQKNLNQAWEERQSGLPYKTPYELLTMASIIEKETAHENDRRHVAAVFVNRLNIGMRLQTDPTVIYGMGDAYNGRIRKADLRRDTPYNTYTRNGLTPTPIALPGKAALEAAAHPSSEKYLYFVSRMDDTGLSQFSHTLDEHNAAVRQYILKRK